MTATATRPRADRPPNGDDRHLVAPPADMPAILAKLDRACDLLAEARTDLAGMPNPQDDGAGPSPKLDPNAPLIDWHGFAVVYWEQRCELGNGLLLKLFARLLRRPDWPVSWETLAWDVWDADGETIGKVAVKNGISRLRSKLRQAGMTDLAGAISGAIRDHYVLYAVWEDATEKRPECDSFATGGRILEAKGAATMRLNLADDGLFTVRSIVELTRYPQSRVRYVILKLGLHPAGRRGPCIGFSRLDVESIVRELDRIEVMSLPLVPVPHLRVRSFRGTLC